MKSFFLDTASSHIIVAIVEDDKILFCYDEENSKDLSGNILPIIDNAFQKTNLKPKDIDTIYVVNGPGSFTGIRVGLTVAKVWSWSFHTKIVPISELELLASTPFVGDYILPLIDARRDYVYAGIYDHVLKSNKKDSHILLEKFIEELPQDKNMMYVSYDSFPLENVIKPQIDIIKVIQNHKLDEGINPHHVNPNYLKMTEAEENYLKEQSCLEK